MTLFSPLHIHTVQKQTWAVYQSIKYSPRAPLSPESWGCRGLLARCPGEGEGPRSTFPGHSPLPLGFAQVPERHQRTLSTLSVAGGPVWGASHPSYEFPWDPEVGPGGHQAPRDSGKGPLFWSRRPRAIRWGRRGGVLPVAPTGSLPTLAAVTSWAQCF